MPKTWTTLETILPEIETGTGLQLVVNGTTVFTQFQVWNELMVLYGEFSFRHDSRSLGKNAFLSAYTQWIANCGYQFYRQYDALTREYNPIYNYEMLESGVDGHKQSKRTDGTTKDGLDGNKMAEVKSEQHGSTKTTQGNDSSTDSGSQTNQHYSNAFDAGITEDGKDVQTFANRSTTNTHGDITVTLGANGDTVYSQTTYQNKVSETLDDTTLSNYNTVGRQHTKEESTEEFDNDVTLTYTQKDTDGSSAEVTVGTDFTDGTMHEFMRVGNIGTMTSSDTIAKELELRKINLLEVWVRGFVNKYCSYLGVDE